MPTRDLDVLRSMQGTAPAPTGLADPGTAARIEELILAAPAILAVDGVALLLRGRFPDLRPVTWSDDVLAAVALSSPLITAERLARLDRGEAVHVDDLTEIGNRPRGREGSAQSMLCVPIVMGGRTVGALVAADRSTHPWGQRQERAVRAYASVLSVALNWSAQALHHEARGEMLIHHLGLDIDADPSVENR